MKKYKNGVYEIEYVAVCNAYIYNVWYCINEWREQIYIGQALSEKGAKQMITRYENKLF